MKRFIKTILILTLLQFSFSVFASVSSVDSIQKINNKQGLNQQEALFHSTILYFQTGSSVLDDEAISIIEKLIADTKNKSTISFILTGFTDPAGTVSANQKLSEKRVENVKKELFKRGFTESQLMLKALGESQSSNTPLSDYSKMRKVEIQPIIFQK